MLFKILITIFVVFALTRVYLRFRDRDIGVYALIFWTFLWLGVDGFVWWPKVSDVVAEHIGIGRGIDALVYFSVLLLFYGMFRLYVKMEFLEREMTSLVRQIALNDATNKNTPP